MNAYEKLIRTMRNEGARNNPDTLQLASMKSKNVCIYHSLELEEEDLYIADHLKGKLKAGDLVVIYPITKEKFVILERVVRADVPV